MKVEKIRGRGNQGRELFTKELSTSIEEIKIYFAQIIIIFGNYQPLHRKATEQKTNL